MSDFSRSAKKVNLDKKKLSRFGCRLWDLRRGVSLCVQHKQKDELSQEQLSAHLPFPGCNLRRLLLACMRMGGNVIAEQKCCSYLIA